MKTKLKNISKKTMTYLMVLVTLCSSFLATSTTAHASSLNLDEQTQYYYTGHSPNVGYAITHNIYVLKMDGKKVFCIESGIPANSGEGYVPESYVNAKKDVLSKIAYYGYTATGKTHYDYAVTQVMIWEQLGDQYISSTIPNYQQRKAEIMALVNKHDTLPSFNNQSVSVTVGESITLSDSNNVLKDMTLESNDTNATAQHNGNSLKITPSATSNDGTITFRKVPQNEVGASIVYKKPHEQSMVEFHLESSKQASVKIDVIKLGNVQVTKIDKETNRPLPNATLKFSYNGTNKEVVTNQDGIAILKNIPEGTKIIITEVKAPNGYVNAGLSQEVTVEPNKTTPITFINKEQKGVASFVKTGETPKDVKVKESDYGDIYSFQYDYKPIAGVRYHIEATKDIKSIDGSLKAKKGDVVATLTTDENGKWQTPELHLGDYQAIEVSAPAGYILDTRPIPFSLTYAGQNVSLASTSLTATNDFQSLDLQLFKDEENISSWKDNQPEIETVKGNGKVFGIFTREEQKLSDKVVVPANALLGCQTVEDGRAMFELKLPQGKYYTKELDAGDSHVSNDTEYEFEFTAENNHATFPIHIYGDSIASGGETQQRILRTPILNSLHFNQFTIKKVDETATFDKETGVTFNFDKHGTGAVFTLADEDEKTIQEITIDENGIGTFENIPVGTFYLTEKTPSSGQYLLSKEIIRIESTKDGVQAFNEKDELIGEQSSLIEETEPTVLFELKNHLIKGTVELTKKDVSTGELLPKTGIRILDKDKKVIVEGRTDEKGTFTFEQLPKGKYYFQEFDAPKGYQLDETPLPFEIEEHGKVVKCEMTNTKIEAPATKNLPQTGDKSNPTLLIFGMLVSVSAVGVLYFRRKKAKAE